MEFREIVMSRYATTRFDGRKVPEEKFGQLLDLIRFAPSALNLQPWRIGVVTDPGMLEQLTPASFDPERIATCSHLLVFCADPDYPGLIRRLGSLLARHGVPEATRTLITGVAEKFTGPMQPGQRLAWSQAQTYLALGNALNGAKALGFDSCPVGGFDPQEFRRILKIPAPLVPVMLCPVGYAADQPPKSVRYTREEIVF